MLFLTDLIIQPWLVGGPNSIKVKTTFNNICMFSKLMDGLRCIDTFTQKCLEREHRAYFNTLYTGTTQVISDLCNQGQYQTGRK